MRIRVAFRTLILTTIGMAMIASANCDSLVLASVGTAANPNQTNSNGHTVPVTKNAAWGPSLRGSSWVSSDQTGDEKNPKFTLVPAGMVVSFFDVFDVGANVTGGTLRVMAADTATVFLNGVAVCADGWRHDGNDAKCSDTEIAYRDAATIDLPANMLRIGRNTLEIRVVRRKGTSFGLDYSGTVDYLTPGYSGYGVPILSRNGGGGQINPPPSGGGGGGGGGNPPITVPEPSSLGLLCAGLVVLVVLVRWRSQNKRRS